jgi:hypothetical protein
MKKLGETFSRNRGEDFVGSSNTGLFPLKCAKTRLQASKISKKNFWGLHPRTSVNKSIGGRDGRVRMKHASDERKSEKPDTRGDKKGSSDFLTGIEVCSIASGVIDAPVAN